MNKFYNSFRLRLMLLCALVLFLVIAAVHTAMYVIIKNVISEQIGLSAQSTATAISAGIMEDIDNYKRFLETRDVNSDYYRRMQKYFSKIKSSGGGIKFIYTERPVDDKTVEFLLDAEPVGSDDYSTPGDTTFMDDASRAVYATRLPAKLNPTVHPVFGTLLGGAAPIFDKDGEILGLTGVNLDVTQLFTLLNKLQFAMLLLYAAILAVCLALLSKYSGIILEPMIKDKMTGAYNKRYFETLIRKEIKDAMKSGTDLALLMLDLDHFKKINDTYGHGFGDQVLKTVSKTIISCLRADDYFFRYGGEEFVVIISNMGMEVVDRIAERIRTAIEETGIYNEETGLTVRMTISIGISHLGGRNYSGEQLMERADKALYKAKVTRNTIAVIAEEL